MITQYDTLHNNPRRRYSPVQSFCIDHSVLKPMTTSRTPLTPRTNFSTELPTVTPTRAARPLQVLPRPSRSEVDSANIAAAYPELHDVVPEYIREKLLSVAPQYVFSHFHPDHVVLYTSGCMSHYQM
jgi:hypothetical protein